MASSINSSIASQITETRDVLAAMAGDESLIQLLSEVSKACQSALLSGGKILLAGNGGSAADAQHIAAEFVNYFNFKRPGLPAIALSTDTSILTSISNDSHFEQVFARQIEALGRAGDVFFAYSTSGNSKNIVNALSAAKKQGLTTVGLTGNRPGEMDRYCDFLLRSASASTPKIQEGHLVMGHIISGIVESLMFPRSDK